MQVQIKLTQDSSNSYPTDSLILEETDYEICLNITNSTREIRVNKTELLRALRVLTEDISCTQN